jgi:hypothetical protein
MKQLRHKNIGNCRLNGIGFDLYERKDGTATIVPDKNTRQLPRKNWMKFGSWESAEKWIEVRCEGLEGASRVNKLIDILL